jgi:hypothetical protein
VCFKVDVRTVPTRGTAEDAFGPPGGDATAGYTHVMMPSFPPLPETRARVVDRMRAAPVWTSANG